MQTIGITGANGFVGRELSAAYLRAGHRVIGLARRSAGLVQGVEFRPFDLDRGLATADLAGVDTVIHGAFVRAGRDRAASSRRNLAGTSLLYEVCERAGTRFVFLSSLSALPDAKSEYGLHKYALEISFQESDVLVVRPGLVVADGGLVRSLVSAVAHGLVPVIDGGKQASQIVGSADLAEAITVALGARLRGRINVCAAEPVTVREMVRSLSQRMETRPFVASIPWPLAFAVAATAEAIGIALPLTTENLRGLRNASLQAPSAELMKLGWCARSWSELLPALTFAAEPR